MSILPTMNADCGNGIVCPMALAQGSFCDTCSFDSRRKKCGSFQPKPAVVNETSSSSDSSATCWSTQEKLYSGIDLKYTGKPCT